MDLIFSKRLKKYVLLREMRTFIKAKTFKTFLRKEVIQPQVPLRLPCYNSHGVTGGVYKARERIHRGMLIHDY